MSQRSKRGSKGTSYRQQPLVPKKKVVSLRRLDRKNSIMSPMLYDMFSTVSLHPHYKGVKQMIQRWLPKKQALYEDGVGNIIIKVGDGPYTTMFSCHIDMIFAKRNFGGEEPPKKLDVFTAMDQEGNKQGMVWGGVVTEMHEDGSCKYTPTTLGADDRTGVFIMVTMIKNKVPGLYIFHVGEEVGGIGSKDITTRSPKLVKGVQRAIAFDRMDYFDIIASQRGGVCASQEFVSSFAEQLNDLIVAPMQFKDKFSSAVGSFTDTANYTHLIPECTNLSVGYFNQHGDNEHQDCWWLEEILMPSLLKVKWDDIKVSRDPTKKIGWGHDYADQWGHGIYSNYGANAPVQTKYVPFDKIGYNTPVDKLPPWTLSRGIIKSASEPGMRRLIEKWQTGNEYTIRSDVFTLLKKIESQEAELRRLRGDKEPEKKVGTGAGEGTNVDKAKGGLPAPVKLPNTTEKDIALLATLNGLLTSTFSVFNAHTNEYTWSAATNADILEWAWKDMIKFNKTTIANLTDTLMEMTVIHTSLVESLCVEDNEIDSKLLATISRNLAFLQKEWFFLGFDTYNGIQVAFCQYKSDMDEEEARENTTI